MTPQLKPVTFGLNEYCGPAVLSILTGKTTDECAQAITSVTGKQVIKAVLMNDIVKTLEKLRFEVIKRPVMATTLYGVLNSLVNKDGLYVVAVPKHVIAIRIEKNQIFICDNHSKEPISASNSARLSQKVDCVLEVIPRDIPVLVSTNYKVIKSIPFRVDIKKQYKYKNSKDDTEISRGYFIYESIEDLEEIINSLARVGDV